MNAPDSGIEVLELGSNAEFALRSLHHPKLAMQCDGVLRLGKTFLQRPQDLLQELVCAAVDICGADSAGISVERATSESEYYEWVATAGEYAHFLHAMLPRVPSACGICLERGTPQLFQVSQEFFDTIQVEAAVITDGILLPWQVEEVRGTMWIMAHGRAEAFDSYDLRTMELLADFTAMGIRQQKQQETILDQVGRAAALDAAYALSNKLAHDINNPLQSLSNVLYLAEKKEHPRETRIFAREASRHLRRVSATVASVLSMASIRKRLHSES